MERIRRIYKRLTGMSLAVKVILSVILIGLMGAVHLCADSAAVCDSQKERILPSESIAGEPMYDAVVVLGAGLNAEGAPSLMLEDRVRTAVELYQKGIAQVLLMSGDSEHADYDETGEMKKLAVSLGVPEDAVLIDPYGLSTYDSIRRAKKEYDLRRVIVVTQKYHLYRALYIAEHLDLEAVGVSADLRTYKKQPIYDVREILARYKDVLSCIRDIPAAYEPRSGGNS